MLQASKPAWRFSGVAQHNTTACSIAASGTANSGRGRALPICAASMEAVPIEQPDPVRQALNEAWTKNLNERVIGNEPVSVYASIKGPVETYDWSCERHRQAVSQMIEQHATRTGPGLIRPVVMKGAAAHWTALKQWNLDWLARTLPMLWVWVRVAPSLRFTYVEPKLMPLYLRFHSPSQAPSMLTQMPLAEFAIRCQQDCPLDPIFYSSRLQHTSQKQNKPMQRNKSGESKAAEHQPAPPSPPPHCIQAHSGSQQVTWEKQEDQGQGCSSGHGEYYYMQTPLHKRLAQDCDLQAAPYSLVQGPDKQSPDMVASQCARLWMSPKGSVSPLHYDSTTSFLTQVLGRKRLIFFHPEDLHNLYPYPNWHILRRRLRFDPAVPDYKRYPRAKGLQALEVILEPGDVLLFPPQWAHYTESLDMSLSMTWRFVHTGQPAKTYRPWRSMCFKWW